MDLCTSPLLDSDGSDGDGGGGTDIGTSSPSVAPSVDGTGDCTCTASWLSWFSGRLLVEPIFSTELVFSVTNDDDEDSSSFVSFSITLTSNVAQVI